MLNGSTLARGIPLECVNGTYTALCDDGTIPQYAPTLLCNALGYESGQTLPFDFGTAPEGTIYFTNLTCPANVTNLDNCSANVTYNPLCYNGTLDYVIQCSGAPAPQCVDGSVRLSINSTSSSIDYRGLVSTISGPLEICVNGQYRFVCGLSNSSLNATDVVATACQQLGYFNNSYNSTTTNPFQSQPIIESISCPFTGANLSQCSINTTTCSCSGCTSVVHATCNRITPACNDLFQLRNDSSFNFANNSFLRTGRIEVCINNTFYPVCANGLNASSPGSQPTADDLTNICRDAISSSYEYLPYQYILSPSDYYTYPPYVVTNITCPQGASYSTSCNYTFGYSCSDYGNESVITCIYRTQPTPECTDSYGVTLDNATQYRAPHGIQFYAGRVQVCVNNTPVTVCDDTAYPEYFASQACNSVLSGSSYTIIPYESVFSSTDYNIVLDNCTNIPQYYGQWRSCDSTITEQCSSPLSVRCERECGNFGQIRLTETNTTYFSNGTSAITGNLQFCNGSQWAGTCSDAFSDTDAYLFCRQFGYRNGTVLSTNPLGASNASTYVNLTCPREYTYYGPSSCSYRTGCNGNEIVLYCYEASRDTCYSSQVRFGDSSYSTANAYGRFPNTTEYSIGNVEVCVNGTFADVCNNTLTPELALYLCRAIDSSYSAALTYPVYGSDQRISYDSNAYGLYNIACPSGLTYPDVNRCTANMTSNGCTGYGGLATVTCIRGVRPVTCSDGILGFFDFGYGTFFNGTSFGIGRPNLCLNNTLLPFCDTFSDNDAAQYCLDGRGDYGSRPYPIIGSPADFGNDEESELVITNLTCPAINNNFGDIDSCQREISVTSGGCPDMSTDSIVTCINLPRPCHLESNLYYQTSFSDSNSYTTVYQTGLCINSVTGNLCANGITDEVATLLCGSGIGTVSTRYNSSRSDFSTSYTGFTCPSGARSLSSCSSNVTQVGSCSSYGGRLVIECTYVQPACYPGEAQITNLYNTTAGLAQYTTGYPSICVNDTFVPICNQTYIGTREVQYLCFFIGYIGAFVGAPDGLTLPPLNITNDINAVVTAFSCSDQFNCTNDTSAGMCSDLGYDNAVVTCLAPCQGNVSLLNNRTVVSNGFDIITGIPITCLDGYYAALCNDGTINETTPAVLCNLLGYEGGQMVQSNSSLYGAVPIGTLYFTNFTCPPNVTDVNNCSANATDDPQCYNGSQDYVLQCYRQSTSECQGSEYRLYNNQTEISLIGYEIITGIPLQCVNGTLAGLCNDGNISALAPSLLCNTLGYEFGLQVNSSYNSIIPRGTLFFTNFTCPYDATDPDDCEADFTTNPQCYNGTLHYTLQCFREATATCQESGLTLYGNQTQIYFGYEFATGVPLQCVNGTYAGLCNDGTLTQSTVALLCNMLGYEESTLIPTNSSSYGAGPQGTFYYTNFTCPPNVTNLDNCSADVATDPQCYNGSLNYVLVCARRIAPGCQTSGLYNVQTVVSNGTEVATGIPLQCLNGTSASLCNDGTVTDLAPILLCREFGYDYGHALPIDSNYSVNSTLRATYYITNFTCPPNATNLDSCDVDIATDPRCYNGSLNYVIQCLRAIVPPQLNTTSPNVIILNNTAAVFQCTFRSNPRPLIQWYFQSSQLLGADPVPLSDNEQYTITDMGIGNYLYTSTLNIANAVFSNSGTYQCNASNVYGGPVVSSSNLTVFVPAIVTVVGPTMNLTEGSTVTITCTVANSFPGISSVFWFKNNLLTTVNSRVSITTGTPMLNSNGLYTTVSTLNISNALTSDSGMYACRTPVIPSAVGSILVPSLSDSVSVIVEIRNECIIDENNRELTPCVNGYCIDEVNGYFCQCPSNFIGTNCETPVVANVAPEFVTAPTNQNLTLNSLLNLTCIVSGAPLPAIAWFKDGSVIPGANLPFYIVDAIQPDNRGYYYCTATNVQGSIQSTQVLVTISDIVQFVSNLTIDISGRRRRQLLPPIAMAIDQAREMFVGDELAPGVIIANVTGVVNNAQTQIVFTVQVAITDTGPASTVGVTDTLNNVLVAVAANITVLNISFSPVVRFDGCLPEVLAISSSSILRINWPEVGIGAMVTVVCPCGNLTTSYGASATRLCNGTFNAPGVWGSPNNTQCMFDQTTTELCELSQSTNLNEAASSLVSITNDTNNIDSVDIGVIGALLVDTLANEAATDENVRGNFLDTIENLFDVSEEVFQQSQSDGNGADRIVDSIEMLAGNLVLNGSEATLVRDNFAVQAQPVDPNSYNGTSLSVSLSDTGTLDDNSFSNDSSRPPAISVSLPPTLFTNLNVGPETRLAFTTFVRDTFFPSTSMRAVSPVFSMDIFSGGSQVMVVELSDPVSIDLRITSDVPSSSSGTRVMCGVWDPMVSNWNTTGVETVTDPVTRLPSCRTRHFSNFALVSARAVQPSPSPSATPSSTPLTTPSTTPTATTAPTEQEYEPEPILFVGLAISLIFIILAALSHLLSDSQRHCPEGRVLMASHLTLFVLYIVFIFATVATYSNSSGFCGVFSGFFHFFSMMYFVWLLVESIFYAVKLRMGIGSNAFTRHYFIIMLLMALVLPALIVIISAAAGHDYYAVEDAFCRPQNNTFYFGYVLPMLIFYIGAWIAYIISMGLIYCCGMVTSEKQYRRDSVVPHLYAGLLLLLIFGLVWIFALAGTQYNITGPASAAMQYIFGFSAIGHSVILLVLSLIRTNDTRSSWLSCLRKVPGRSGKYDFAQQATPRRGTGEVYGLDASGKYLTDTSGAEASAEEKQPLSDTTAAEEEPRYVTTTMIEKEAEAAASTVVINEEALVADDEDKKTDL